MAITKTEWTKIRSIINEKLDANPVGEDSTQGLAEALVADIGEHRRHLESNLDTFLKLLTRFGSVVVLVIGAASLFFGFRTTTEIKTQVAQAVNQFIVDEEARNQSKILVEDLILTEVSSDETRTSINNNIDSQIKTSLASNAGKEFEAAIKQKTKEINSIKPEDIVAIPTGTILPFYGKTIPPGFLLCDGNILETKAHEELSRILISANPELEVTNSKFRLPDLQGMFLRGLDPEGITDRDRERAEIGSVQEHALLAHQHDRWPKPPEQSNFTERMAVDMKGRGPRDQATAEYATGGLKNQLVEHTGHIWINSLVKTNNVSGTETRPVNVAVNWIIKY